MSTTGAVALGVCLAYVSAGLLVLVSIVRDHVEARRYRRGPSPEVQAVIDAERAALRTPGAPYVPGEQPEWHGCPAPHATGWDRAWEARGGIR
jgi:hypothetical protein